jgi:hypothetical protein
LGDGGGGCADAAASGGRLADQMAGDSPRRGITAGGRLRLRVIYGRGIAAFGCGDFRGGWARGSRSWVAAGAVYTPLLIVVEMFIIYFIENEFIIP